jgi:hypothetical protein
MYRKYNYYAKVIRLFNVFNEFAEILCPFKNRRLWIRICKHFKGYVSEILLFHCLTIIIHG